MFASLSQGSFDTNVLNTGRYLIHRTYEKREMPDKKITGKSNLQSFLGMGVKMKLSGRIYYIPLIK